LALTKPDLLDPFLLPSLAIAIIWLIHNIWESNDNRKAANSIHLLQALTKTPTSSEARAIHKTILAIVAEPFSQLLESSSGSKSANPALSALLTTIQPNKDPRATNTATKAEIESWTSTAGGVLGSIRNTCHSLLYWDTSLIPSAGLPRNFTYKQIDTAVHFHGAADVLHILIDELKLLSGTPNFDAALDILSSLICARAGSLPEAGSFLTLREALRLEYDGLAQILKKSDLTYAEAVVRLRRRVDTLSVVPPQADVSLEAGSGPIVPELTNMDLQNMDLDATTANADIDVTALQNAAQAHPEDIDRMLNEAAAAPMLNEADFGEGGLDVGDSMDDIFAGLTDTGDMGMGNFDDLDMEGMF
jgi:mediator of RNA polymerase II transcription subunit 5